MILQYTIENTNYELTINPEDKLSSIKEIIIQKHFAAKKDSKIFYIQFEYSGSKSIRDFGKHSLIVGDIIPNTLDNLNLLDFSEKEHLFKFNVIESTKDIVKIQTKPNTSNNTNKYIPSFKRNRENSNPQPIEFIINDYNDEFPPLG